MFLAKVVEQTETYIVHSITFYENCAVYEIIWTNVVEPERPQMTIWHMSFPCWISKATNIHSEYVILIVFSLQQ